jgi:hypothetical protein
MAQLVNLAYSGIRFQGGVSSRSPASANAHLVNTWNFLATTIGKLTPRHLNMANRSTLHDADRLRKPEESSSNEEETKNDFQFVSVVATSDGRTKPSRQALVRKNAARYQWRRNKPKKGKNPVQKDLVASTFGKDLSVVLVEQDEESPHSDKKDITGSYGLHESRISLQIYYNMSLAQDVKVAKSMSFSRFVRILQ